MNDFYMNKAAVPRQARTGSLRERLQAWRELRLSKVVESCDGTLDEYRIQFSNHHQEISNNMLSVLSSKDEYLFESAMHWVDVYKVEFEKSFKDKNQGPTKDAYGLCGAELKKILAGYKESIR